MDQHLTFAIAGFGHIGKRHAMHIMAHPECRLTAVCDTETAVLESVPGDIARYATLQDLLQRGHAPDVLSICTPNYLHAQQAIEGLNAGCHVIVEKPMALSIRECDAMIEAAERNHRIIFAVKQNRYNPPVKAVKALIDQGRLGEVLMLQVNCFWNRGDDYYAQSSWRGKKALDGGCLFTQFSHFIDILYYLNGPLTAASGSIANYLHRHNTEIEDSGSFVLKAANGATVSFTFTTCAHGQNMEGSITVFGSKGTVKIGGQYLNTIDYQALEGVPVVLTELPASANDYGRYKGSMSNHDQVIANVVNVLRGRDTIMTSAAEGREVIRTIELMYAAAQS